MLMGRRQKRLLLWVAAMNSTAPLPNEDDALAAFCAEAALLPRPIAEFRGVGAVAAEGADGALLATQTAGLGLSEEDAKAVFVAERVAEAPAAPDELFRPAFNDDEEMFDACDKMSAEWELQFVLGARADEFQVDADAANEQKLRDAMDATIRTGPVFFVTMYDALTTDARFSQDFVDRVRRALHDNWIRLGLIHSVPAVAKASEPRNPALRPKGESESTSARRGPRDL